MGRLLQSLRAIAALGIAAAAVVTTSGPAGCGKFCDGGFVRPVAGTSPGVCESLCAPSKCANAGNVCVDNRCELQCASLLDCSPGQDCVPATTDGAAGSAVTICQNNGKSAIGASCPFGSECAMLLSCPDGSNCDYTQCGGMTCTVDPAACVGTAKCATGKCPDGSACTVPGCTKDQCKPLTCLSSGAGDASAVCTLEDCQTDANCPGGYWCKAVRDPHQICGAAALPSFCGTTKDPCVDPTKNMANGTTFVAGSVCTERNECRPRKECDPCASDIDCSLVSGLHCTQVGTAKNCTYQCATDAECHDGFECTSGACVPRFGSCTGTGKFCEPCHTDGECGSGLICVAIETGGEHFCLGIGVPCTSTGSCPKAPSGLHGACVMNANGNNVCDVPQPNTASMRPSCWCSNLGSACYVKTECCSNNCVGADAVNMVPGTCK